MNSVKGIVWFRNDLRVDDHPALTKACQECTEVVGLYVYPKGRLGRGSSWWLSQSLKVLHDELSKLNISLIIREGDPYEEIGKQKFDRLYFNRHYEPSQIEDEKRCAAYKPSQFIGSVLIEPHELATKTNKPYQHFTPFWKHYIDATFSCCKAPERLAKKSAVNCGAIKEAAGHYEGQTPGLLGAKERLEAFVKIAAEYPYKRDFVALDQTSTLSPHLHFGEISPRVVWQRLKNHPEFLRQLVWRDFAIYLLWHFPHTLKEPLYPKWKEFPWTRDKDLLNRWKEGNTGFPIVDAGMRQLLQTGLIHNRARLICASFLVKDLLIHWEEGANWFYELLLDADLANNTMNWQWVAGCGADAAPFFRIFNPTIQADKFDPDGAYVKRFVPSGKRPEPMVDHNEARIRALELYRKLGRG